MIRLIVTLAVGLALMVPGASCLENANGLVVEAFHTFASPRPIQSEETGSFENTLESKGILSVSVLVRNNGASVVRVATRYKVDYFLTKNDRCILSLVVKPQEIANGIFPVVPESDLGIVELRPGDVAWIGWGGRFAKLPEKPLFVRYVVDQKLANRYNLWVADVEVQSNIAPKSSLSKK